MNESQMTLARDWRNQNPKGWFVSEKLDGCRAYWDGRCMWTRGGNIIALPKRILISLPTNVHLDGEIWAGHGRFEEAKVATQYGKFTHRCQFVAFDCPSVWGDWMLRLSIAAKNYRHVVTANVCGTGQQLYHQMQTIQANGGEGLMIRNPKIQTYEVGRTYNLLKVK